MRTMHINLIDIHKYLIYLKIKISIANVNTTHAHLFLYLLENI